MTANRVILDGDDQWSSRAACLGVNPAEFFDGAGLVSRNARWRQLCSSCPVRGECLDAAMTGEADADYRFGIFGGLTPGDRWRLADLRSRAKGA